ncbi:Ribonuclease P protein component [hydrothermal vent metagenome]|uniref:Ribonuclease P protein component n=1 Tax=hydrothermal vent metagenome TaxID=652676 RepID=A0A1W1CJG4_9ZZZZ
MVASKKVGNAVARNRAKRLLRSHLINHIDKLNRGRYILVAKPLLLDSNYQQIDKQFFNALRQLKALKQ